MTAPGYDYNYSAQPITNQPVYPPLPPGPTGGLPPPPGPNVGYAQPGGLPPGAQPVYPQPGAPITVPPSPGKAPQGMMMMSQPMQPPSIPGCPPGLEYLAMVDQILVKQQIELAEILFGCEMKNKYKVMNSMGQQVYFAVEDTDCCTRNCCGSLRPFEMQVLDNFDAEVLHFSRPLRCQGCCCCCCLQTMEVSSPRTGTVLGYVNEVWSICIPKYTVHNAANEVVFHIEGPFAACKCCADVEFKIFAKDGTTKIGAIRKQWMGIITEGFTDADNFNISFPLDLDVPMKAVLLGALMLIDFMYFESQQNHK